jgi:hypothetical protein
MAAPAARSSRGIGHLVEDSFDKLYGVIIGRRVVTAGTCSIQHVT